MARKTPDKRLEQVRAALTELRMKEMAAELEKELTTSRDGDSRLDFIWRLVEPQLIATRQRSATRRVKTARLPAPKSFDDFDFAFQPKLDRDRVLELAALDFVRRGENLLVAGMSGTGKSHICIAIGYLACAAGIRTRYTTSAEMLSKLAGSLAAGTLAQTLKGYVNPQLLIIDEVGLDRPELEATPDAQLFYKVIRPRHQNARSTVITSNIEWEKWGTYLGDDVATVAILDRLIEHGHLLTIEGPSYRAREHKKLNAPRTKKKPTAASTSKRAKAKAKPKSKSKSTSRQRK